ncbi:hypothetical protein AWB69_09154 [Caballeronia udeis]|uniref:Uncharacterized protein n=1 Tax=Caballeronia udeis TaxID=1232866 RepID=A0A158JZI6_9BURK|nr:hypothetical protein AWB69_09154 [Caballeronia udeis]
MSLARDQTAICTWSHGHTGHQWVTLARALHRYDLDMLFERHAAKTYRVGSSGDKSDLGHPSLRCPGCGLATSIDTLLSAHHTCSRSFTADELTTSPERAQRFVNMFFINSLVLTPACGFDKQ